MTEIKFCDLCTDFTCSTLFIELTKLILYSKQQIPITYDKLNLAVHNYKLRRASDVHRKKICFQSEKLFSHASRTIDCLEELFRRLAISFANNFELIEVAFFLGGSLFTPKQVYRFNLPKRELGHLPKYHARQAILSELLQFVVHSNELNEMFSKPLEPTNLFLLFKTRGEIPDNSWFLPRPRYSIPASAQQVYLNLSFESPNFVQCSCKGFQFYSDDVKCEMPAFRLSDGAMAVPIPQSPSKPEQWYQAPLVFKGFKDIYVNGISVSKRWMTPSNDGCKS